MASISTSANGCRTVQFVAGDGRRRSIRLGRVSKKQAEAVKSKVEALNAAAVSRCPIDGETARWVAEVGDDLAARLAAVGLIPERCGSTLGEFLDDYMAKRTDVKERTRLNLDACRRRLLDHFGAARSLASVTPGDADDWLLRLKERYAPGTVGRAVKRAKQFFKTAVRRKLIPSNPFDDLKPPSQTNTKRLFFVTPEATAKVLDSCPDVEWRLIVAMCRYGGVRCPSELLPLRWDEVLWDRGRFRVHSPKTEHHEGGAERWVPIFPELRPHLEAAFEAAGPGTVYLVNRYRGTNTNLRTQLQRIIKRAGLKAWPKLFQNLRASRETELAASHPLHVVCEWIGNSAPVAAKHYLQVTEADFEKAAGKGGAERGAVAVQNAVQSGAAASGQELTDSPQEQRIRELEQLLAAAVRSLQERTVPPRGLETDDATGFPGNDLRRVTVAGAAKSGAVAEASALAAALQACGLSRAVRDAVLALVEADLDAP